MPKQTKKKAFSQQSGMGFYFIVVLVLEVCRFLGGIGFSLFVAFWGFCSFGLFFFNSQC